MVEENLRLREILKGSDDVNAYFAAFDWITTKTETYRLRVTFFESVNAGTLIVVRDEPSFCKGTAAGTGMSVCRVRQTRLSHAEVILGDPRPLAILSKNGSHCSG